MDKIPTELKPASHQSIELLFLLGLGFAAAAAAAAPATTPAAEVTKITKALQAQQQGVYYIIDTYAYTQHCACVRPCNKSTRSEVI